jgi:hypothetical protein
LSPDFILDREAPCPAGVTVTQLTFCVDPLSNNPTVAPGLVALLASPPACWLTKTPDAHHTKTQTIVLKMNL